MHPQASEKRIACNDFFEALEACHAIAWKRYTGWCNQDKNALNRCLHGESLKNSARNREDAKVRKAKAEKAKQDLADALS
ncbi:hypothetical protein PENSPDRAFT_591997 [Peniophora sp. CONT]|nr:hypothetical protein PENSPDRAFT_591997 [Peniophora sp. CONT]